MPLVFGAIAPHGGIAIAEACDPAERDVAAITRAGMEELGRRFDAARPDVTVVVTPHNVHISNAIGVLVAARLAGALSGTHPPIELDVPMDMELAWSVLGCLAARGVPSAGVSFGSNDPSTAVAPMDWGILIPLWFMGGRHDPPLPVVAVTPARDLPAASHIEAGAAIAAAAELAGVRVALIASADHGHAHLAGGPYGYHPAALDYDMRIKELVLSGGLEELSGISPELVEDAKADSWWQLLVLHGATAGPAWRGRLISYEAPTYFGMLTAAYEPVS
ncbi:MAG TPA: extradiol ring-cleavage dioxygenase [Candidatus Dormibacteraeota bacterium]